MIRGLLLLLVIPPYAVLAGLLGYPLARLLRSPRVLYALGRFGSRLMLRLAGVRLDIEGRSNLAEVRNTVAMSNHMSHMDAAVLFGALDVDFKAVAKTEVFRFPFLGPCLRYVGFIEVDRKDPVQSRRAIRLAVESLRADSAFLVFPEGTRSRDGELGEFKKGGFVVAIEAGSRIIPIALDGTQRALPRGAVRVRPATVRVRILDPLPTAGYSYDQRDLLSAEVRARIAAVLDAWRGARGERRQGV